MQDPGRVKTAADHVYEQHLDEDAFNFPLAWRRYLDADSSDEDSESSEDSLIDMPEAAVMEYVVDVYVAKMAHDAAVEVRLRERVENGGGGGGSEAAYVKPSFAVVALEILECREFPHEHGAHKFHVRVRSLARALQRYDGRNTWLYLFSRLAGCYTRNGRVRAIPQEGASFVCGAYRAILPALFEARKRIPHGVNNDLQRVMRGAKHQVHVGYVALGVARNALRKVHRDIRDVEVARGVPLPKYAERRLREASDLALTSLSKPLAGLLDDLNDQRKTGKRSLLPKANLDNTVTTLVPCVDFLLLVANIWTGVHALEAEQRAKDLAGRSEHHDIEASHRESFRKSLLHDDPSGKKRKSGKWATAEHRYGAHRPERKSHNAHPYRQKGARVTVAQKSTKAPDGAAARPASLRRVSLTSGVTTNRRRSSVAHPDKQRRRSSVAKPPPPPKKRGEPVARKSAGSRESSIIAMSVGAESSRNSGKLASRARTLLEYELFGRV